jgi:hypothetical protein
MYAERLLGIHLNPLAIRRDPATLADPHPKRRHSCRAAILSQGGDGYQ